MHCETISKKLIGERKGKKGKEGLNGGTMELTESIEEKIKLNKNKLVVIIFILLHVLICTYVAKI